MINDFKNIETIVKSVLRDNKETRNSDKRLLIEIWKIQGLNLTDEQERMFMKCASPESIRRSRQRIQEMGFYESYEPVRQARLFEQEKLRKQVSIKI